MKLISALGIVAVPGTTPTGNLLWVDSINGNDSLARRGCLTVPFKTLTAAKTAAQSGDTIVVMPGTYNEKNLLRDYVNWYFLPGAVVSFETATAGAIFDTSSDGINTAIHSKICGYGRFHNNSNQGTGHVVNSVAAGSDLEIHALTMSASGAASIRSAASTGTLAIKATGELTSGADVVLVAGGSSTSFVTVEAAKLYTSGGNAVRVTAGGLHVRARIIESSSGAAVIFTGSDSIKSVIEAYEIKSQSSYGLHYNASGPVVTVRGARIVSAYAASTGYAVYVQTAVNHAVKLLDCVLIVDDSANNSIHAANTNTMVHMLNGVSANKAKHSNVTVIGLGLTVDSLIS